MSPAGEACLWGFRGLKAILQRIESQNWLHFPILRAQHLPFYSLGYDGDMKVEDEGMLQEKCEVSGVNL